ncbi:MAG: cyclic nucleotide-binding domain-containing protein [Myxococcota bacterium]|nr:cyclic nucleotide-binding domain-containing protein [Myxococcota bacterium]
MNAATLRPIARTLLRSYQVRSSRSIDLAEAMCKGRPVSWSDGEVICAEGDPSSDMFIILKGSVRVMRNDTEGRPRELAVLKAPTMIGQMGLVDGSARSASCLAVGKVGSLSISLDTFRDILSEASAPCSAFRHLLLASMNMQLSTANEKIRRLVEDIEQEQAGKEKVVSSKPITQEPPKSSSERLMEIAGVLDGWNIDASGVDDVDFVEDEDMKRTREARSAKRRR